MLRDNLFEKALRVITHSFDSAQGGGQRTVRFGFDDFLRELLGKSAGLDEVAPAGRLCCRGDGVVFGGELCDGGPLVVLNLKHLMSRKLGAWTAQAACEHGSSSEESRVGKECGSKCRS